MSISFEEFSTIIAKPHPERIQPLSPDLVTRIVSLTGDMTVNLDDEVEGDVRDAQELQAVIEQFLPFASTDTAIIQSSTVLRRLPKL